MAASPSTDFTDLGANYAGASLRAFPSTFPDSTGRGTQYNLGAGFSAFAVQVEGLSTGDSFQLKGSLDGVSWSRLGSTAIVSTGTDGTVQYSTSLAPVQFVRLDGVSISTGSTYAGWISAQ